MMKVMPAGLVHTWRWAPPTCVIASFVVTVWPHRRQMMARFLRVSVSSLSPGCSSAIAMWTPSVCLSATPRDGLWSMMVSKQALIISPTSWRNGSWAVNRRSRLQNTAMRHSVQACSPSSTPIYVKKVNINLINVKLTLLLKTPVRFSAIPAEVHIYSLVNVTILPLPYSPVDTQGTFFGVPGDALSGRRGVYRPMLMPINSAH